MSDRLDSISLQNIVIVKKEDVEALLDEHVRLRAEAKRLTKDLEIAEHVRSLAEVATDGAIEARRKAQAEFREAASQAEYRRQAVVAAQQQVQLIAEQRDTLRAALREAVALTGEVRDLVFLTKARDFTGLSEEELLESQQNVGGEAAVMLVRIDALLARLRPLVEGEGA